MTHIIVIVDPLEKQMEEWCSFNFVGAFIYLFFKLRNEPIPYSQTVKIIFKRKKIPTFSSYYSINTPNFWARDMIRSREYLEMFRCLYKHSLLNVLWRRFAAIDNLFSSCHICTNTVYSLPFYENGK